MAKKKKKKKKKKGKWWGKYFKTVKGVPLGWQRERKREGGGG